MGMRIKNQGHWQVLPLNITEEDPDYEQYRGPLGFIPIDCVKVTFKDITQLLSKFIFLSLQ